MLIDTRFFQQDVWLEFVDTSRPFACVYVGIDIRKISVTNHMFQIIQSIIKLMVAICRRIISHRIHDGIDRMY
ncbi:hypothetical protein D3C85_1917600 [compost metagenome]